MASIVKNIAILLAACQRAKNALSIFDDFYIIRAFSRTAHRQFMKYGGTISRKKDLALNFAYFDKQADGRKVEALTLTHGLMTLELMISNQPIEESYIHAYINYLLRRKIEKCSH